MPYLFLSIQSFWHSAAMSFQTLTLCLNISSFWCNDASRTKLSLDILYKKGIFSYDTKQLVACTHEMKTKETLFGSFYVQCRVKSTNPHNEVRGETTCATSTGGKPLWKPNYYTSLLSQIILTESMNETEKREWLGKASVKPDGVFSPVGAWNCLYCFCCDWVKSISNFLSIAASCSGPDVISSSAKWGGIVGGKPNPAGGRASSSSSSSSSGSVRGSPFSSHSSTTSDGKFPTFPSSSPSHLENKIFCQMNVLEKLWQKTYHPSSTPWGSFVISLIIWKLKKEGKLLNGHGTSHYSSS